MSVTDIIKLVGDRTGNKDTASILIDGLTVNVQLLDVKRVFGRIDVLITPISGNGQRWVQADRLNKEIE